MAEPDYEQIKQRSRAIWGLGDYAKIADQIRPAARALVDACAISAGQEVLDVAAGNGNLAVIAGEEGASVVASDLSPAQVELGKARTEQEGLDIEWVVADAEQLPFEDERFDCAASVFGAMFAPRPELAAQEMFRVVRPGGTVGLAVWGPYGAQAEIFTKMQSYGPGLPEGVPEPRDWGVEEIAEERLAPLASSLRLERTTMRWEHATFDDLWTIYRSGGPGVALAKSLEPGVAERMLEEVRETIERWNQADDGRIVIEAEYLQIVARKRG
jgi:SAM-dependent methyltransferase